jgi:hypothetical protein
MKAIHKENKKKANTKTYMHVQGKKERVSNTL